MYLCFTGIALLWLFRYSYKFYCIEMPLQVTFSSCVIIIGIYPSWNNWWGFPPMYNGIAIADCTSAKDPFLQFYIVAFFPQGHFSQLL